MSTKLKENSNESSSESGVGFIVHPFQDRRKGRNILYLVGRLENGETFAVCRSGLKSFFYVREKEREKAESIIDKLYAHGHPDRGGLEITASDKLTMDGEATLRIESLEPEIITRLDKKLRSFGVRTYEADIPLIVQYLTERHIHSSVKIGGSYRPGKGVSRIYEGGEVSPASWNGALSVLSFDIETDRYASRVYTIAYVFKEAGSKESLEEAMTVCPGREHTEGILYYSDEKEMLKEFILKVRELDPDIITGWNVLDFDFRVLCKRCEEMGLSFTIGRTGTPVSYPGKNVENGFYSSRLLVEGRQVLDGLWLTRISLKGLYDYRLETVAKELLGEGKEIELLPGEEIPEAVERLYRNDPVNLSRYCLADARLVLDILEKEKLLDLTIKRALHVGLPMDQTWRSVASFEFLYLEKLHDRGFVAPTLGVDRGRLGRAPGGGIILPRPGLYMDVLVFDFRSLYPTLITTFNIDPLAYVKAMKSSHEEEIITAPNGARFVKEPGILPEILKSFFESRARARDEGDEIASYAYKIIMNSFYGVLGTESCRFSSLELAGAVTSFGQHILHKAQELFTAKGYRVLYGDTDSLFVLSALPSGVTLREALNLGNELCKEINTELEDYIGKTYLVKSHLELEFEKYYRRFFLPPIRETIGHAGSSGEGAVYTSEQIPGRVKGYAGLKVSLYGGREKENLEIVGMEAIRRDWTELARKLQVEMLNMVFHDAPAEAIKTLVKKTISEVLDGRRDKELVYAKNLRKPVSEYTRTMPPHVRAASMLEREEQQGTIRYCWTRNGPEPESKRKSPIDYNHYIEKQVKPIVNTISAITGMETGDLFADGRQLELF